MRRCVLVENPHDGCATGQRIAARTKALWSNDPPDENFRAVLANTSDAHVVTFDNPLQCRDASNTVYIGVKASLPL
jgi:hypothetical protein